MRIVAGVAAKVNHGPARVRLGLFFNKLVYGHPQKKIG